MSIDLHTHTSASDGSDTPSGLVAKAVAAGLAAVAITDHDTVDGLEAALTAPRGALEVIPGIEFTTDTADCEVHVLGYYLDRQHPGLLRCIETIRSERVARAKEIVARLGRHGIDLPWESVWRLASAQGFVGRGQIIRALREADFVPSDPGQAREFLNHYFSKGGAAYVPHSYIGPKDAIAAIRAAGGVPVLAHPGRPMSGTAVDDGLVASLTGAGLMGLEAYYPTYEPGDVMHLLRLSDGLGLIPTGGTDYHGRFGGVALGTCGPPDETLPRLKAAAAEVRLGR